MASQKKKIDEKKIMIFKYYLVCLYLFNIIDENIQRTHDIGITNSNNSRPISKI